MAIRSWKAVNFFVAFHWLRRFFVNLKSNWRPVIAVSDDKVFDTNMIVCTFFTRCGCHATATHISNMANNGVMTKNCRKHQCTANKCLGENSLGCMHDEQQHK